MKLYYSDVLSPRKACAVAAHLDAPVEYVYLDLARGEHKTPDYLKLNPNGKVPTLVDGERTLWEADAIMCELSRRAGADLWPDDAERQIEILRWLSWDKQHFGRTCGELYFEHIVKRRFADASPAPDKVERAMKHFHAHAAVLDAHLSERTWLVGERLSVADFAVAVALPYAQSMQLPLDTFPAVQRWNARLETLDAWQHPFPQRNETPSATA
ncbi:glutathione S-transferase family protein [Oleiagrimonas sp. MCCC 1A03011]|uniref:glutathione S-transferase family protein n=1 Tax=Oleiagrimonas sp. MCCC 1A03011 TaxID=1926883 RepID=UPI000DC54291|nr:glutathione S-transferase family protein [Oleiagrimonas sp. MCCC 1A03011]RAP57716.1 glutathione S-transferase [Oleiagrimonas sp. MCCC 1A03011]